MVLVIRSNVAVSGFIAASAESKGTKAVATLSALAAFAPMVFTYRWQFVEKQHDLYKKRIYGPVVSTGLHVIEGQPVPMLLAGFQF
jgi:hypothetical protein